MCLMRIVPICRRYCHFLGSAILSHKYIGTYTVCSGGDVNVKKVQKKHRK